MGSSSKRRRYSSTSRGRDRDRDREREKERDREAVRRRDRDDESRHRRRHRSRSSSRRRHREREREKEREREREKEREREREREKERRRRRERKDRSRSSRREWRFDSPPREDSNAKPTAFSSAPDPSALAAGGFGTLLGQNPAALALVSDPSESTSMALMAQRMGLSPEATKAARELYVGNLPPTLDVARLVEFLNAAMLAINANILPGPPAVKAWISADSHFAFVEFRTMEEATNGMQLNGLNCLGYNLRIGRPKTYPPELAAITAAQQPTKGIGSLSSLDPAALAGTLSVASDPQAALRAAQAAVAGMGGIFAKPLKPERYCLLDLPDSKVMPQELVRELVTTFGILKIFQYFDVPATKKVKQGEGEEEDVKPECRVKEEMNHEDNNDEEDPLGGTAVCILEYEDLLAQQCMVESVQGITLGGRQLQLLRAEEAVAGGRLSDAMQRAAEAGRNLHAELGGELMKIQAPTRVLMLTNLVTREELLDEKEYLDILEDVRIECNECGKVLSLEIPRPVRGFEPDEEGIDESDVGFAFVEFTSIEGAGAARKSLSGRRFAGRTVEAHYFSERLYNERNFKQPQPNYSQSDSSLYNPELAAHVPPPEGESKAEGAEGTQDEENVGQETQGGDAVPTAADAEAEDEVVKSQVKAEMPLDTLAYMFNGMEPSNGVPT